MNSVVQAGVVTPFEVTYVSGLPVRASIYDTTLGSAVFLSNVVMTHVLNGTYVGFFTPTLNKTYLIVKVVYTDITYATPDAFYPNGSETLESRDLTPGTGGGGGSASNCELLVVFDSSLLNVSLASSSLLLPLTASSTEVLLAASSLEVPLSSASLSLGLQSSEVDLEIASSSLQVPISSSDIDLALESSELSVEVKCAC